MLAGWPTRFAVPFHSRAGRTGLGQKFPPQFGQTFSITSSTQRVQNVHSNVQMAASVELGGSGLLQCSQVGLSSSILKSILKRVARQPGFVFAEARLIECPETPSRNSLPETPSEGPEMLATPGCQGEMPEDPSQRTPPRDPKCWQVLGAYVVPPAVRRLSPTVAPPTGEVAAATLAPAGAT